MNHLIGCKLPIYGIINIPHLHMLITYNWHIIPMDPNT